MKLRNILTSFVLCSALSTAVAAPAATVSSPNSQLKVNCDFIGGLPMFSVELNGVTMLDNSPLGFVANVGDFSHDITFEKATTSHKEYDYSVKTIKKSNVHQCP